MGGFLPPRASRFERSQGLTSGEEKGTRGFSTRSCHGGQLPTEESPTEHSERPGILSPPTRSSKCRATRREFPCFFEQIPTGPLPHLEGRRHVETIVDA